MMKDDVRHRKTRKIKRKRGKTRTLKVGGMQGQALRDKVDDFMAQATGLLNDGQTFTPQEYSNLKTAVEDALTHDRGDSRNPRALGSAAPRTARFEDRKKSAMNEIKRYLPQDKTTPENRSTLEQQVMALMDADHARQLEVANATKAATEVEASDGTMVLPDQLARHEENLRVKREQVEKATADARKKEENDRKKQEKKREASQKAIESQVDSLMGSAIKEHVTSYIMDWSMMNDLIQKNDSAPVDYDAGVRYVESAVVTSMPSVLSAYDFVTSNEPVTEQRYNEFISANKGSRMTSSKTWNEIKNELTDRLTGESMPDIASNSTPFDIRDLNPSAPPAAMVGQQVGGADSDSTVVTILPSPLLRDNSGAITDLVLNGTLCQLYPMDPFFRPNAAQCPVSILANNSIDSEMFAKGYGNKILQPGGALTTLDFLNSSNLFTDRLSQLPDNQYLCYNLFFQQTNVPKNVAYMLMCIANNGFERPGPTPEPIVKGAQKYWDPVSLEWRYRMISNGSTLTLNEMEAHNGAAKRRGADSGASVLYDVRYVGTRNDCNLDAIVSMAVGANAPILPIYCWTNGKTGFFDSQRFPDNIVTCELFNQIQRKMGGEGKIFNDSIMNNIIRILPPQYNNKCTFKEVDKVALSVPGLENKIKQELSEAIQEYWSSPAVKRTNITKQWQRDGRLVQRMKLTRAILLFNSKQGEFSSQMMSLNKVPFLVPELPDATNLEAVRSYYADFFANIPVNALDNPIMPVYGSVSYLNASNLSEQINSPGYGSGSSMMLWLILALTLFPEHPNRLNELLAIDKLTPDNTVNFTVTGLEEELDSPEVVRNFTVIVLQAISRELFSRAFQPSSAGPLPKDVGSMMNSITEARNLVSDKRDASRSFYERMTGSNKYTPEQAAKKRQAIVEMNQYLLGDNLRVCKNANAIAGESTKTGIGLKWVQPVTRTEQDNFIQERSYFNMFNKQRTEAEKQKDLDRLEDRQDGFLQSGVACIFNNDTASFPLSRYTNSCKVKTTKCAPLTPTTNFAFILANMQMAYIKMKYRATLLDKPDKQEFVNDLGNYGLRYIEKYFGNSVSNAPEWLSKSGYKNAPPGGVVGTKVFDPKEPIWVPILKPMTTGSMGNSRVEVRVDTDGTVNDSVASEPSIGDYQEVVLYDYLLDKALSSPSDIFSSLAALDSGEIYEDLRSNLKRLAVLIRNMTDTPEFKQKQNIAKAEASADREKNIKLLVSDGFKEAPQADGSVMWVPPNIYADIFNDPKMKNKKMSYDEAIEYLEPDVRNRIAAFRDDPTKKAELLTKVVSKAQQPRLAARIENVEENAKKLNEELKSVSTIGEVNRIIDELDAILKGLNQGPDNQDGSKNKAMEALNKATDKRDMAEGITKFMEDEDKKATPNKFYLETLKPILKTLISAFKKRDTLEEKKVSSDVVDAEIIVDKKPFDLSAFEDKMASWTDMIKDSDTYSQEKQAKEYGEKATQKANKVYQDARDVLEKEFRSYGTADVPEDLEAQNRLLTDIDKLTEKFEGASSVSKRNKALRDEYNKKYQRAEELMNQASSTLRRHRKDVAVGSDGKVGKDWQTHKNEIERLMNDIKELGKLPDPLKEKFADIEERYKSFTSQIRTGEQGQRERQKKDKEREEQKKKEREEAEKEERDKQRAHDVAMKLAETGKQVTATVAPKPVVATSTAKKPDPDPDPSASTQPAAASESSGRSQQQPAASGPAPGQRGGDSEIEMLRNHIAKLESKIKMLEGGSGNSEEIERKLEEFNRLLNMTGGAAPIDDQIDEAINNVKATMNESEYGNWIKAVRTALKEILGILDLQYSETLPESISDDINGLLGSIVAIWCYSRILQELQETVKTVLASSSESQGQTSQNRTAEIVKALDAKFQNTSARQMYAAKIKIVDDYYNKPACKLSGGSDSLSISVDCMLDSTNPSPSSSPTTLGSTQSVDDSLDARFKRLQGL